MEFQQSISSPLMHRRITRSTAYLRAPLFNDQLDVNDIDDLVYEHWMQLTDDDYNTTESSSSDTVMTDNQSSHLTTDMNRNSHLDNKTSTSARSLHISQANLTGWQKIKFNQDAENLSLVQTGKRRYPDLNKNESNQDDMDEVKEVRYDDQELMTDLDLKAIDSTVYDNNTTPFITRVERLAKKVKAMRMRVQSEKERALLAFTSDTHVPVVTLLRASNEFKENCYDNVFSEIPEIASFYSKLGPKDAEFDDEWMSKIKQLKKVKSKNSTYCTNIRNLKRKDPLFSWIMSQHHEFNLFEKGLPSKLTLRHIKYLQEQKLFWQKQYLWEERFLEILRFKAQHGHTAVPRRNQGYDQLHNWVSQQRRGKVDHDVYHYELH